METTGTTTDVSVQMSFLPHLLEATASHYKIPLSKLNEIIKASGTWKEVVVKIKAWKNSQTFDIQADAWTHYDVKSSCVSYGITVSQYMSLLQERGGWDRFRERASELRAQNLKELEEKQRLIEEKAKDFEGTTMKMNQ